MRTPDALASNGVPSRKLLHALFPTQTLWGSGGDTHGNYKLRILANPRIRSGLWLVAALAAVVWVSSLGLFGIINAPAATFSRAQRGLLRVNGGDGTVPPRPAWAEELLNISVKRGAPSSRMISFQYFDMSPVPPFWFAVDDTLHSADYIVRYESDEAFRVFSKLIRMKRDAPDGKCWMVDVGSNGGFYSLASRTLGCSVHAIDAQPRCLVRLNSAAAVNGFADGLVTTWSAVGMPGVNTTVPVGIDKCSGLWGVTDKEKINAKSSHTEHVPIVPLTELLAPWLPDDATVISFLKVDVEGNELEVLRSALPLLLQRRIRMMLLEVAPKRIAKITKSEDAISTLTQMYGVGYVCNKQKLKALLASLKQWDAGMQPWECYLQDAASPT